MESQWAKKPLAATCDSMAQNANDAHQNVTYTCINSAAWYDIHSRSYKKSIRLLGDNDDEFSSTSTNKPVVEIDGCKMRKGESKTVFSLQTKKTKSASCQRFLSSRLWSSTSGIWI